VCVSSAYCVVWLLQIAKFLEERCYKDLRSEQMKFINIVTEAYNKMLCHCKDQMAYFATSLLNVVTELLDNSKQDTPTILGCQTLTRFIYSQVKCIPKLEALTDLTINKVHGFYTYASPC
jgi:hypothetical protein